MKKTNTLSEKIIALRLKAGASQEKFGKMLGISQTCVSKFESNLARPRNTTMKKLVKIGAKYGVEFTIEDMLNSGDFYKTLKKRKEKIKKIIES